MQPMVSSQCVSSPPRRRFRLGLVALTVMALLIPGGGASAAPESGEDPSTGPGIASYSSGTTPLELEPELLQGSDTTARDAQGQTAPDSTAGSIDFTDVPPTHTFHRFVTWMAEQGLTRGYADGTYGVNRTLTRGEAAAFLYRLSGDRHVPTAEEVFRDVPAGSVHAEAISWMKAQGYSTGYADGTFGRDRSISRGEMATFLYRSSDVSGYRAPATSSFTDLRSAHQAFYYGPAHWMAETGIVTGYTDGTFRPLRAVTRGEAAKFIYVTDALRRGITPEIYPEGHAQVFWTTRTVTLYSSSRYTAQTSRRAVATLAPHTKVLVRERADEHFAQVTVLDGDRLTGTTGWTVHSLLTAGRPGTTRRPHAGSNLGYVHQAQNIMAPWCWKVPTRTDPSSGGGLASYQASTQGGLLLTATETITLGTSGGLSPSHPAATAIVLHECAHILQYRASGYDINALKASSDRVFPNDGTQIPRGEYASGVEHMADCIADQMGARRNGPGYSAGYGASCSTAQRAAARTVISGRLP